MNILDEIFANKRREVKQISLEKPLAKVRERAESAPRPLDFTAALRRPDGMRPRLIAEIKQASPSRGQMVAEFDPIGLARIYQQNGASAISVLTDERFFRGRLADLERVARLEPRLPVLRKDFIFDPYQVYEARAAGASAILLIATMIEASILRDLRSLTSEMGMAALIEIHTPHELEDALAAGADLVGVNNRNLQDFTVDLATTQKIRPQIPAGVCVVAESGIHQREDVDRLCDIGVDAILVGEALVTAPNVAEKVKELSQ